MGFFAGSHRAGLLTVLTALLLPALGVGVASAEMNVGDTFMLKVPDLAEFAEEPATHQFTCRAVTEHAYWLVQDTVSCDKYGKNTETDSLAWGVTVTQEELDTLTMYFEGAGIDVWGTVTSEFGVPLDTDGDPKVWIVMATIPTKFASGPSSFSARNNMTYVSVEDLQGEFNAHDIFYLNIHSFATVGVTLPRARAMREFYLPNGLAKLSRLSRQPMEEEWLLRGLSSIAQYSTWGFTSFQPNFDTSLQYLCTQFGIAPYLELTNYQASNPKGDFAASRGQQFLWLMYLAQNEGADIIGEIALSDTTGLLNIARAIDPSVADSVAVQTNITPIYNEWIVCNLVSAYRDDMSGGIYTYEFLDGETYQFGHIGNPAAFIHTFGGPYPMMENWIASTGSGLQGPIWAIQYCMFVGDYAANPTVNFNGQYSDGSYSGPPIDAKWSAWIVAVDPTLGEILYVTPVSLNDLYTGSFELGGEHSYLVVTNNNPGGVPDARFLITQDTDVPDVLISALQNSVNDQYITLYTTPYDEAPEGFDWYGPRFTATVGDSSSIIDMETFYGSLWSLQFNAWEAGGYVLEIAGFDSTGLPVSNTIDMAVGWVSSNGLQLDVNEVRLDIPAGSAAPGAMITISEADMLGLAVASQSPLESAAGQMTGIIAGPVSIPDVSGTISFPANTSEGAVHRYSDGTWQRLDSWFQGGRMSASVSDGGIYVFGQTPGVTAPEIPADFRFGGTFPNPFSAETAIRFSLPSTGHVSAMVFDMSGRVISILSDEEMQAAEHTLVWDGTDVTGSPVAAGVYFCRLQAAGQTITQKMLRIE